MAVAILIPQTPRPQPRRVGRPTLRRRELDLDKAGFLWQEALDSAAVALDAATIVLPPGEIRTRRRQLELERDEARTLLLRLACLRGVTAPPPWPLHATR
jgi:hypothetical protein